MTRQNSSRFARPIVSIQRLPSRPDGGASTPWHAGRGRSARSSVPIPARSGVADVAGIAAVEHHELPPVGPSRCRTPERSARERLAHDGRLVVISGNAEHRLLRAAGRCCGNANNRMGRPARGRPSPGAPRGRARSHRPGRAPGAGSHPSPRRAARRSAAVQVRIRYL